MNKYFTYHMRYYIVFGIIIFLIILVRLSCVNAYSQKDFELSENEKALMKPFHKGDTLFYESSSGEVDTIFVLGIDSIQKRKSGYLMAKRAYNEVFVSIRQSGDTTSNELLTIIKSPQQKTVEYFFDFKRFFATRENIRALNKDTVINGKVLRKCYVIRNSWPGKLRTPEDVECIYWTKNEGMVGYKCYSGTCWITRKML